METIEINELIKHAEDIANDRPQNFPEAASTNDVIRQGDIFLWTLEKLPQDIKKIPARLQLTPSNETSIGSRHCLDSLEGIEMYEFSDKGPYDGPVFVIQEGYIRSIPHPEHGCWQNMKPGIYGVSYQRTVDSENQIRRVLD
jgi:hypothetical protein